MSFRTPAALAAVIFTHAAHAQIVATFDADAEGWGLFSDGRDFGWSATIGNPPGAITARDVTAGDIWFFSASAAFLGSRPGAYGGSLSWDIYGITGNQTSATTGADVILTGGGITIGIDAPVQPVLGQWRSGSVELSAVADWRIVTDAGGAVLSVTPATEAQMRTVLAGLTGVYIRGEYTNGADSTALDNVRLDFACAADRNGDAAPTVDDLLDFLIAYREGDISADVDGDGSATVDDLLEYLIAYRAGC